MRLTRRAMIVAAVAVTSASMVQAEGWFKKHFRGFVRDAQRNNAWPEAFVPGDRIRVREPFAIQVANAWQVENTLSDHHFDPETGKKLTEAGKQEIAKILLQAPPEFRTIFIVRSLDPEITAARVSDVFEASGPYVPPGQMPSVSLVNFEPRTTPSYYVDAVDRAYRASMPVPRLSGGTGGGGMGGGGGLGGPPGAGS